MEYLTDLLFFFKDGNGEEYSILDVSFFVLIQAVVTNQDIEYRPLRKKSRI